MDLSESDNEDLEIEPEETAKTKPRKKGRATRTAILNINIRGKSFTVPNDLLCTHVLYDREQIADVVELFCVAHQIIEVKPKMDKVEESVPGKVNYDFVNKSFKVT